MSLNIRADDRRVQETLNRLQARVDDLEPVMREVAGHLMESTDEAIATQTAPDGSTWEPLAESTIVDRLRRRYRAARSWSARGTSQAAPSPIGTTSRPSSIPTSTFDKKGNVLPAAVHHDGRVPARSFFAVSDDARAAIIWSGLEHIREPVDG